ncbi:MAG: endonuclease domain-containing protein [Bacteroidales bacterium]|nr:endonuclease domain-containing protein [Bacteroidales bacterium]
MYGYRFRAQHPINIYIVDFYCHPLKLVIEIDGEIHENEDAREYDKGREDELREFGLHIIRFTSDEVLTGFEKVKQNILDIAWHLKNSG